MDYPVVVDVAIPTSSNNYISRWILLLVLDNVALPIVSIWSRVLPLRNAIKVKKRYCAGSIVLRECIQQVFSSSEC
jgi:hypothetical protein